MHKHDGKILNHTKVIPYQKTRDSKMRVLAQTTTFLPLLWYANAVDEN